MRFRAAGMNCAGVLIYESFYSNLVVLFYTKPQSLSVRLFSHTGQRVSGLVEATSRHCATQAETSVSLSMGTLFMPRHGDLVLTEAQTCNNNK